MTSDESDGAYENQAVVSVAKGIKSGLWKQTVFLMFHLFSLTYKFYFLNERSVRSPISWREQCTHHYGSVSKGATHYQSTG